MRITAVFQTILILISPIAIAYNMGQIIKPVCLCTCVRLRPLTLALDFYQNWHRRKTLKHKTSLLG